MEITIYTINSCKYCLQLKELMTRAELDYTEILCNTKEVKEEMVSKYPEATTFPHVIMDGESIGGLVETAKLLVVKGLVKSKR